MSFDNTGKGALWSNEYWTEDGDKPRWRGHIVADRDIKAGEQIPLSVWPSRRSNERSPVMRLKVDRWKEQQPKKATDPVVDGKPEFDDGIPF